MKTGTNTHNQSIERIWRGLYEGVLRYLYNLIYYMEDEGLLHPLNQIYLTATHNIYMDDSTQQNKNCEVITNRSVDIWSIAKS